MKKDLCTEYLSYKQKMEKLLQRVTHINYLGTNFQKLDAIGQYYKALENEILAHHKIRPTQSFNAYAFEWNRILNEVESIAWDCLRTKGHLPLYPQYPVLNYFLDFGNPVHKIGFEIDGKKWHNLRNDIKRDTELKKEGWTIIRVSGKEMMGSKYSEYFQLIFEDESEPLTGTNYFKMGYWFNETGDGVLEAIKIRYFTGLDGYNESHHDRISELVDQTLENHVIID